MRPLLSDAQLEKTCLDEIQALCRHCLRSLSPGSGLSHCLAQIELRALWLARHYPLSELDQSSLEERQRELRNLLCGQPRGPVS